MGEACSTHGINKKCVQITVKPRFKFSFWRAVDMNTKVRKISSEGNLTLRLLAWYHCNLLFQEESLKWRNVRLRFHCINQKTWWEEITRKS